MEFNDEYRSLTDDQQKRFKEVHDFMSSKLSGMECINFFFVSLVSVYLNSEINMGQFIQDCTTTFLSYEKQLKKEEEKKNEHSTLCKLSGRDSTRDSKTKS